MPSNSPSRVLSNLPNPIGSSTILFPLGRVLRLWNWVSGAYFSTFTIFFYELHCTCFDSCGVEPSPWTKVEDNIVRLSLVQFLTNVAFRCIEVVRIANYSMTNNESNVSNSCQMGVVIQNCELVTIRGCIILYFLLFYVTNKCASCLIVFWETTLWDKLLFAGGLLPPATRSCRLAGSAEEQTTLWDTSTRAMHGYKLLLAHVSTPWTLYRKVNTVRSN